MERTGMKKDMNNRRPTFTLSVGVGIVTLACFVGLVLLASTHPSTAPPYQSGTTAGGEDASLLDGYRHVEVASVSDAIERVIGKKLYMSHHMRPLFPSKFAGFAVTVLLKIEANHDPHALDGMLAAIDQGTANS